MKPYNLKKQVENIKMPQSMRDDILYNCKEEIKLLACKEKNKQVRFTFRWFAKKLAAAALAVILCFTGVSALVVNVPDIYNLIYYFSPETAQFFIPVKTSCVDNGIMMTVEAVYIGKDRAQVMLSLKDLTGQRVDSTTDLNDSYSIYSALDYSANCKMVKYSEEERKAYFLVDIKSFEGGGFDKDKVTFSLRSFLSGGQEYCGVLDEIDLTTVCENPETKTIVTEDGKNAEVIKENMSLNVPVNNIEIAAAGRIDGDLHVKVRYKNTLKTDSHGWIYLQCGESKIKDSDKTITYKEENGDRICEYIFTDAENLDDCKLYTELYTKNNCIEGYWRVTFFLEE